MPAYLINHDRSYHRTTLSASPDLGHFNIDLNNLYTHSQPGPLRFSLLPGLDASNQTRSLYVDKTFLDGAGETERAPERFRVGPRVWTGPWSIIGFSGSIDGASVRDGSFLSSFGRSGEGTIVPGSREVCSEGATSMGTSPSRVIRSLYIQA
jgi:hypothetical protein